MPRLSCTAVTPTLHIRCSLSHPSLTFPLTFVAVANLTYTVQLLLAELYWVYPTAREFNVSCNGQTELMAVDIIAAVRQCGAVNREGTLCACRAVL